MIQVVTFDGKDTRYNCEEVVQYSLHDIRSLDEYEIDVIDLSSSYIWRSDGKTESNVNVSKDLNSIVRMIKNSKTAYVVIVLPQNENFYYYKYDRKYLYNTELKDMLYSVRTEILSGLFETFNGISLTYENTRSHVGSMIYEAAFYFEGYAYWENEFVISSIRSQKPTVIQRNRTFMTTLKISDTKGLTNFLDGIGILEKKEVVPNWISEIKMFDDIEQETKISEWQNEVERIQDNIKCSQNKLADNMRMKSILYTSGDKLVEVVFDILEELMGCDLSGFVDDKKEDFLFEVGENVFIGEIKGVKHNVKNENISQLEVHFQGYLDEHEDKNPNSVKALLIMNHQNNKAPEEREPVKDTQINLAKRNGSLIIETTVLLNLLEEYRSGKKTREMVIDMIANNSGLLKLE